MKNRLPVSLENRELPVNDLDNNNYNNKNDMSSISGFVNVITLSAIITICAGIMSLMALIK